jgi:multidrug resistance efflux pump
MSNQIVGKPEGTSDGESLSEADTGVLLDDVRAAQNMSAKLAADLNKHYGELATAGESSNKKIDDARVAVYAAHHQLAERNERMAMNIGQWLAQTRATLLAESAGVRALEFHMAMLALLMIGLIAVIAIKAAGSATGVTMAKDLALRHGSMAP